MTYQYQPVLGGYRWNMMERIRNEVGVNPTASGDSGGFTFVNFAQELTPEQKTLLDALMASNPTQPPSSTNTKFVIRDVWNQKSFIESQMGLPYKVYYSESVPGSGNVDQIEMHFGKVLSTQERNKIVSEYAKLITLK